MVEGCAQEKGRRSGEHANTAGAAGASPPESGAAGRRARGTHPRILCGPDALQHLQDQRQARRRLAGAGLRGREQRREGGLQHVLEGRERLGVALVLGVLRSGSGAGEAHVCA